MRLERNENLRPERCNSSQEKEPADENGKSFCFSADLLFRSGPGFRFQSPERDMQAFCKSGGIFLDRFLSSVTGDIEPASIAFHQIEFITAEGASSASAAEFSDNLQCRDLPEGETLPRFARIAVFRPAVFPVVLSFEIKLRPAASVPQQDRSGQKKNGAHCTKDGNRIFTVSGEKAPSRETGSGKKQQHDCRAEGSRGSEDPVLRMGAVQSMGNERGSPGNQRVP